MNFVNSRLHVCTCGWNSTRSTDMKACDPWVVCGPFSGQIAAKLLLCENWLLKRTQIVAIVWFIVVICGLMRINSPNLFRLCETGLSVNFSLIIYSVINQIFAIILANESKTCFEIFATWLMWLLTDCSMTSYTKWDLVTELSLYYLQRRWHSGWFSGDNMFTAKCTKK